MNQTIYFRKKIWDQLKDEPKKSELVNQLLEKHYKGDEYPLIPNTFVMSKKTKNTISKLATTDRVPAVTPKKIITGKLQSESVFARATPQFCKHNAVKGFCKSGCK